jgi:hypothetical protein
MAEENPEAKLRSRATLGNRVAGLPLDGCGSGGKPGLSADAVIHLLYVFLYLSSREWRLDLLC